MTNVTMLIPLPSHTVIEQVTSTISFPFGSVPLGSGAATGDSSLPALANFGVQTTPVTASPALDIKIGELNFSTRTSNCFREEKIATLGDLVQKSAAELLQIQHFGKGCLKEVRLKLGDLGLSLREESVQPSAHNLPRLNGTFPRLAAHEAVAPSLYVVTPAQMKVLQGLNKLAESQKTRVWFRASEVARAAGCESTIATAQTTGKLVAFGLAEKTHSTSVGGLYRISDEGQRAVAAYNARLRK